MKFWKFFAAITFLLAQLSFVPFPEGERNAAAGMGFRHESLHATGLYASLGLLDKGLAEEAFTLAVAGMQELYAAGKVTQHTIISIADLSQSSCKKRLYVIDLAEGKLLFQTYVAHGRNSGEEYAASFSNQPSSYKSSLGFYTTMETYTGQHGLSLRLKGEEPGINDQAFDRAIVMHGADYVNADFIDQNGRLGRSQGCPAVPVEQCDDIVNTLKGGSCLFLYYPDQEYLRKSALLHLE